MPGAWESASASLAACAWYPRSALTAILDAVAARRGWVIVVRSTVSMAIVLASALSARRCVLTLVARTTGRSARTPAIAASCSRSGPAGSSCTSAGQRTGPAPGEAEPAATISPSRAVSTSSELPPPEAYSRFSPARYSRQSKVSSQVRRTVRDRPAAETLNRGSVICGRLSPLGLASSAGRSTNSRTAFGTTRTLAIHGFRGMRRSRADHVARAAGNLRQIDPCRASSCQSRPVLPAYPGQRQPHAPPQQPPPRPEAASLPVARPPTETVESNRTVSSWPCGQAQGSDDSLIGRDRSKVSPQARQRYSYRGTPSILRQPRC